MLGTFLKPEYEELIRQKDWASLRDVLSDMDPADIAEVLADLPDEDSGILFRLLPRGTGAVVFEYLPVEQQGRLVGILGTEQLANVLNEMAPDDRTRLLEELPAEVTKRALTNLRPEELRIARQLLGYPEDSAGRYMTPEYLALTPEMTTQAALAHIRAHGRGRETLNILYITDEKGRLLGEVRLSTLVLAPADAKVGELEDRQLISLPATTDREEVVQAFEKYDRVALPVTDSNGVLLGIITVDDVLDVAEQEATEDIQKIGGMEALEAPYLSIRFRDLLKKRAGWLLVLFLGEMLTASALALFEHEIAKAVVLTLFIPLIISSGGNSGSQATSLVIRSLSVRELDLRDWQRVLRRELVSGLALGCILGTVGLLRVVIWPVGDISGGPSVLVGITVALSLVGVVLFGTLSGAMLPLVLRRLGFDPATASAPLVATLVDVTGLIIYFGIAILLLTGTVL